MKKKTISLLLVLALVVGICPAAFAASSSWSTNSEYYKPKSGTITSRFYPATATEKAQATTTLVFQYNPQSTANIKAQYDAGRVIGMDIKNVKSMNESAHMMEPLVISTTLPNPKKDIEANGLDMRPNEAEVMALSQPSPNIQYEMIVTWRDYRSGNQGNNGQWNVNAELSTKGWFDEWYVWDGNWASCTSLAYDVG